MRLKHLVVILLVSCGQDSMTAMSTMPTTYIMNSCSALYSISQAQTPKNYYCNQVQVVDDVREVSINQIAHTDCLLYTSPSPRDLSTSRMPSSA